MLEKDPGESKENQLCLIVIVEDDMNARLKIIWNGRSVPVTEAKTLVHLVEFGNYKDRTALDALLLKIITMDCFRLLRLNPAMIV
eukprot:15365826-Ditylum_brightwellii.AAC.2